MGLIIILVPLLIYYIIIVPLVKTQLINKKITNPKIKRLTFILLLLFPVGDHIIGYMVYKALCFTNGGVKIYKTVTDEREQRDYWFYDGLNVFDNSYNDKEFEYLSNNNLVKRGICTNLLKDGVVGERICAKNGFKEVYLNYCSKKYDNLPITDPDYKRSCKNAEEIIKKYNLENVIKVPKSPYRLSVLKYSKKRIIPFLEVYESYSYSKNRDADELLAEHYGYQFRGGWYIKTFNPYQPFWTYCRGDIIPGQYTETFNKVGMLETIIPNPYKKSNPKGE